MNDSVELLKECDAGLEMAISSLEQVKPEANADNFLNMLDKYHKNHIKIQKDIDKKLVEYNSTLGCIQLINFFKRFSNLINWISIIINTFNNIHIC